MIPAPHVAIITGGAGGLGLAMGRRLLADGLHVAFADLDPSTLPEDVTDTPTAMVLRVDVTSADEASDMVDAVGERFGRLDVLINGAGIAGPTASVADYPVAAWHGVVAVSLFGTFHCTRACLPAMVAAGYGRIVNIASIAAQDPNPGMSAYCASKAGVIAMTKSVAKEVATTGVLVNCLVPGVIRAGLTDRATDEERALFLSKVPMGRMGEPEELAELASWLSSPRCSFSTGATFDLSGGRAVG